MIWEQNLSRMGFQIRAMAARKQPLPDWVLDEPPCSETDRFFLEAFERLDTCRGGMGDGRIPWTAIEQFCRSRKLGVMMTKTMEVVIMHLDLAVMVWRRRNKPKGGTTFMEKRNAGLQHKGGR